MDKKATVVFGDTYTHIYGCEVEIFGIATTEEELKKIMKKAEKEGFKPETKEVKLGKYDRVYLDGYYE